MAYELNGQSIEHDEEGYLTDLYSVEHRSCRHSCQR